MPRHHAADPPTGDEIAAMMRRRFTRARVMQHAAARRTDAVLIFEGMIDWMERNALRQLGERLGLGPGGRDASLKCGQRREHSCASTRSRCRSSTSRAPHRARLLVCRRTGREIVAAA
jgi:hypothetical protein